MVCDGAYRKGYTRNNCAFPVIRTPDMRHMVRSFFDIALFAAGCLLLGAPARADCLPAPALPAPSGTVVEVDTVADLQQAVSNLVPGTTILIAPGTYALSSTLYVRKDNVSIRGASDRCDQVVLVGKGMENASYGAVPHGIWSDAANLKVQNLSINEVYFHAIQLDPIAEAPHIYNVRMLDAGEQFVKGSSGGFGVGVDNGIVEYSIMEYTAGPPASDHGGGTGYTNGVDIHGGANWQVRDNLFKNFHTPDGSDNLWNPAILMWNGAQGTISERNVFINVDRAIAYGLIDRSGSDHSGGIIRNNFVYIEPGLLSAARIAGTDGLIIVWDSPSTKVLHNTVLSSGNFNKSIEFRFQTTGGEARNNLVDAPLGSRNDGSFAQSGNSTAASAALFVNSSAGDLHLKPSAAAVIDQVPTLSDASSDIDGEARPVGAAADIGADEYKEAADTTPPARPKHLRRTS